jgi:recombinational DNA repair protein RecT
MYIQIEMQNRALGSIFTLLTCCFGNYSINLEKKVEESEQTKRSATNVDPDQNAQSCSLIQYVHYYSINLEMS